VSKVYVLDSSAFLAMVNEEPGASMVEALLPVAVIGAVNLAEIVSKLRDKGVGEADVEAMLALFNLDVRPLTAMQAFRAGHLRDVTRHSGLSLGDRACLSLAMELGAVALTADREWQQIEADALGSATVKLIR